MTSTVATRTQYRPPQPVKLSNRTWPDRNEAEAFSHVTFASVCLRDGNQALENPMSPEQKLEYFHMLVGIGFKEIEVGFPSASQDDYEFIRLLIEKGHIPDDVTIAVLTQCREDLIRKTFESLVGVKQAIVHAYIATSELHMQGVFQLDRKSTISRAVHAVELISMLADQMSGSQINLEFSPEEFTDTDIDFALEICEAVFTAWNKATPDNRMIFNLPATVERMWPHRVADKFEYFCRSFTHRESVIISAHPHNDQDMATASATYAVLAGADRVEGTLFRHGERTGNVDLVIMILNCMAMGIELPLEYDFSNLSQIVETVVRITGMPIDPRHPYVGELVYVAFSGSHQDAISKGLVNPTQPDGSWKAPYLIINPADVGRMFEKIIRINAQSGKGGIAHVLREQYGISIPKAAQPFVRQVIQGYLDHNAGEATAEQVMAWFKDEFMQPTGSHTLVKFSSNQDGDEVTVFAKINVEGSEQQVIGTGNGPINAFVNGLAEFGVNGFKVVDFVDSTTGLGSEAAAVSFVKLTFGDVEVWGAALDTNSSNVNIKAILAAISRSKKVLKTQG